MNSQSRNASTSDSVGDPRTDSYSFWGSLLPDGQALWNSEASSSLSGARLCYLLGRAHVRAVPCRLHQHEFAVRKTPVDIFSHIETGNRIFLAVQYEGSDGYLRKVGPVIGEKCDPGEMVREKCLIKRRSVRIAGSYVIEEHNLIVGKDGVICLHMFWSHP